MSRRIDLSRCEGPQPLAGELQVDRLPPRDPDLGPGLRSFLIDHRGFKTPAGFDRLCLVEIWRTVT
jgi:hypothetical protein